MQATRSTVHITEKMYDILQRTNVDERLKAGKMIKTVFDAVLTHTINTRKRLNALITESNSTNKSKTSSTNTKKQKTSALATPTTSISEKVKKATTKTTTNTQKSTTKTTTNIPKSALRNSNDKIKVKDDNGDNRQNKHPKFTPPTPTWHHQQKDERIPIGHTYAGSNFNPEYRKSDQHTTDRRVLHNPYDKHHNIPNTTTAITTAPIHHTATAHPEEEATTTIANTAAAAAAVDPQLERTDTHHHHRQKSIDVVKIPTTSPTGL